MSKLLKLLFTVLLVVSCSKNDEQNSDYNLSIISKDGNTLNFVVENAVSPEELQKGLMNRESLQERHGMIFNLKGYDHVGMWMKNTLMPLDMIFVNDGAVVWIFENAQPNSTEIISAPVPANAVIELNAGDVKKYNIKVGDTVKHAFFNSESSSSENESNDVSANPEVIIDEEELANIQEIEDAESNVKDISDDESLVDDGNSGETVINDTSSNAK